MSWEEKRFPGLRGLVYRAAMFKKIPFIPQAKFWSKLIPPGSPSLKLWDRSHGTFWNGLRVGVSWLLSQMRFASVLWLSDRLNLEIQYGISLAQCAGNPLV